MAEWLFEKSTLKREDMVQARVVKEANLQLGASAAGENFTKRLEAVERV